jgi:S-adenosylmethionine decarboxylase
VIPDKILPCLSDAIKIAKRGRGIQVLWPKQKYPKGVTAMEALGKQILVELYDCASYILNDRNRIERVTKEAVQLSGATIIATTFHTFSPFGVSGVVVIAESHVAIHTWPEYGYAAVDIFTCGDSIDPWAIKKYLKKELVSKNSSVMELKRGVFDVKEKIRHKVS